MRPGGIAQRSPTPRGGFWRHPTGYYVAVREASAAPAYRNIALSTYPRDYSGDHLRSRLCRLHDKPPRQRGG